MLREVGGLQAVIPERCTGAVTRAVGALSRNGRLDGESSQMSVGCRRVGSRGAYIPRAVNGTLVTRIGRDPAESLVVPTRYATKMTLRARPRPWEEQAPSFDILSWMPRATD